MRRSQKLRFNLRFMQTLTAFEPVVSTPIVVEPPIIEETLTTLAPIVSTPVISVPITLTQHLTEFQPDVEVGSGSGDVTVVPGVLSMLLHVFDPDLSIYEERRATGSVSSQTLAAMTDEEEFLIHHDLPDPFMS